MIPASPAAANLLLPGENATARTGLARPTFVSFVLQTAETMPYQRERVENPAGIVVEDVDRATLVPTGRELAVCT